MELRTLFLASLVTGLGIGACQAKYSDADFGTPRATASTGGSSGSGGGSGGSGGDSGDCSESQCSDEMAARGLLGVCVEGRCEAMGCVAGRDDCHSDVDGCETSTDTDRTACGDCDTHCGAEAACIESACTPYALAFHVLSHTQSLPKDPLLAAAADGGVFVGYQFDRDLHLDELGHVFEVEFAPSPDAGLIRLDADGNLDFALSIRCGEIVDLRSVSSSQQGVVAAGYFRSGGGSPLELETVDAGFRVITPNDLFTAKDQAFVHALDQLGNHRFTVSIYGEGNTRIYASTADDAGNVYVLGSFSSSLQIGSAQVDVGEMEWGGFIAKLLPNGARAWALVFDAGDEFENFLHMGSLAVDATGRLYYAVAASGSITVGETTSDPGAMSPRLLALEPDGSLAFLHTYSSVLASMDSAHPIVGPDNRVFLVMNVSNTQSAIGEHPLEQGPHLIEIDPSNGDPLANPDDESRILIHPLSSDYELTRAAYGDGEIVIVGQTIWVATAEGELDLGGGPQPYDNSALNRNPVVVGVGLDGAFRWGRHYGSSPAEPAPNVAANGSGQVFVGGTFSETMTIDGTEVAPAAGMGNHYVFRFVAK